MVNATDSEFNKIECEIECSLQNRIENTPENPDMVEQCIQAGVASDDGTCIEPFTLEGNANKEEEEIKKDLKENLDLEKEDLDLEKEDLGLEKEDLGLEKGEVEESFNNINSIINERLDLNRVCLMILLVLVIILIYKEEIMKSNFVKGLLK